MTPIQDPLQAARVALITGANTGIGRVTARELAQQGLHVFVACRSEQSTQALLDEVPKYPDRNAAALIALRARQLSVAGATAGARQQ